MNKTHKIAILGTSLVVLLMGLFIAKDWKPLPEEMPLGTSVSAPSESGLVGMWSMDNASTTAVIDLSGNGNDGAIASTTVNFVADQNGVPNQAMDFDGVGDYVTVGNIGNIKTFSAWVYPTANTKSIVDFDGGTISAEITNANLITATGWTTPTTYVNGVAGKLITLNSWNFITITSATNVNANALILGKEVSYYTGSISDVAIYSSALTQDQVSQLYKAGRTTAKWKIDPTSGVGTTTPKLQKGLIFDMPLQEPYTEAFSTTTANYLTTKDRTPYANDGKVDGATVTYDGLVDSAIGDVYINQDQAYGTWEFDVNKADDANIYVHFINSDTSIDDGYRFALRSTENIQFDVITNGAHDSTLFTSTSYISADTNYRFKITRSLDNHFTSYIKGGVYGWDSWTQIVESTGANPTTSGDDDYTSSTNLVVSTTADSGNSISNLKIDGKRHSLADATVSSGTWTTTAPSYDFDGTDDYIDLGLNKPTNLTGDITVSAWINPEVIGIDAILDNGEIIFYIYPSTDKILFSSNGGGIYIYSDNNSLSSNIWQHILVTRPSAGTNTNIYINGILGATANQNSGTPAAGTTNTFIGNRATLDRDFDGDMSDFKIWNRVLSASEVDYLYSKEKSKY